MAIRWVKAKRRGTRSTVKEDVPRIRLNVVKSGEKKSLSFSINQKALSFIGNPEKIKVGIDDDLMAIVVAPCNGEEAGYKPVGKTRNTWKAFQSIAAYEEMVEAGLNPALRVWYAAKRFYEPIVMLAVPEEELIEVEEV